MKGRWSMGKHRKYGDELKKQVVEEYLSGGKRSEIVRKYGLSDGSRIREWREQYLEYGCFPDNRGKAKSTNRPKRIDPSHMTKDEYIAHLEMENDVLKQLRSLSNNRSK